ncbi:MAG: hypothetical protein F4Y94_02665 [Chloroflexi bacterium]|nr:hypothetical protein [Chloroflexota bacterium]
MMFEPTWRCWAGHAVVSFVPAVIGFLAGGVSGFVTVWVVMLAGDTVACFGPRGLRAWLNEMFWLVKAGMLHGRP